MEEGHIKRPMNAFMAWSKGARKKMVEAGTMQSNASMSRILGEQWRGLPEDERKVWKRMADKLKKEHAKMYPTYKYKPRKRNSSSCSENLVVKTKKVKANESHRQALSQINPKKKINLIEDFGNVFTDLSNDGGSCERSEDNFPNSPESTGSLDDLDFVDDETINDANMTGISNMQNLIDDVMKMENFNEPIAVSPKVQKVPYVASPKATVPKFHLQQAMLAPKLPPIVKTEINMTAPQEASHLQILGSSSNGVPTLKVVLPSSSVNFAQLQKELNTKPALKQELKMQLQNAQMQTNSTAPTFKIPPQVNILPPFNRQEFLKEENAPDVDNPRLFTELLETEANYIGDIDRTFDIFEKIENTTKQSIENDKHLLFMKRLDIWGHSETSNESAFDGFSDVDNDRQLIDSLENELGLPQDWMDEEVFEDLDKKVVWENVFLNKWLPKCALKTTTGRYRKILRTINSRDPEFNIVW